MNTSYRGRGRPRKTDARSPKTRRRKDKPADVRPFDQRGLDNQLRQTDISKGSKRPPRAKPIVGSITRAESYVHTNEKRKNIPETGLFANFKDDDKTRKYRYDPNQDPTLWWSGKEERPEFDVDTVPLHIHERIDPMTLVLSLAKPELLEQSNIVDFFDDEQRKLPYFKAIDFYEHEYDWANRLIAGDSLNIMNSLIEKEGMEGKVKMIYFDPPYGINYNSNFQTELSKKGGGNKDEDLSKDPETIRAFRDTWELGIHSYLTYLRDRFHLSRTLLRDDGSIFVQISDDNVHRVRIILDEVFGAENFISQISFQKTTQSTTAHLSSVFDIILWYAKDKKLFKSNTLFRERTPEERDKAFNKLDIDNGKHAPISRRSDHPSARQFRLDNMYSNHFSETRSKPYVFDGREYRPPQGQQWRVSKEVMDALAKKGRLVAAGNTLMFKNYYDDFPYAGFTNIWTDTVRGGINSEKIYVVQTTVKVIQRCMLMATNPGDLVLDPTCGSGTTAFVAEKFGRRWITCDTSQVAISLARMRLMSAVFDYYKLRSEADGVCGGFQYEAIERKTKKSIAGIVDNNGEKDDDEFEPQYETLYDKPLVDSNKKRVSGPFTLESASPPTVESLDAMHAKTDEDSYVNKLPELAGRHFQDNWRTALKAVGVSGRTTIKFENLEPHPASRWIHASGMTADSKRAAVSFGPEYGTMDTRQIQYAREELRMLNERFDIVILAAMQFDPTVHDEVAGLNGNSRVEETYYMVDINKDLMNRDLKSPKSSKSATFWMIGQPDAEVEKDGDQYTVEVRGFDYMDPKTGEMRSGNTDNIAIWSLDTNYDGRCMYPRQVFFPMSGSTGEKLYGKMLKNLRAVIDEDRLGSYMGTRSLPFRPSTDTGITGVRRIAVKVVDEAGRETMRVLNLD